MKNLKLFLFVFFLIFALAFFVPVITLCNNFFDSFEYKKIRDNGIEVVATPISYNSNLTVNGVNYYCIEYQFEVDGQQYGGKTSSQYRLYDVSNIFNNNKLLVKYDPKTMKSCESDYGNTSVVNVESIMFIVFGLVDIGFWITEIVFIVKFIKSRIVKYKGKIYTANLISVRPGVLVNNVPMYKLEYCWKDENDKDHQGLTGSDYTQSDVNIFEKAGSFKIKAYKNNSIVVSNKSELFMLNTTKSESENEGEETESYVECEYCHSIVSIENSKCPSCGAPLKYNKRK